ncbi:MAG: acetoin utilization protein AcuC [Alphaproteobacteria bacterium]|nr:acetoin utilization protein AcuC [Alphaproteobacteria bacterium]
MMDRSIGVYLDDRFALYSFGKHHPFNEDRYWAFKESYGQESLNAITVALPAVYGQDQDILRFHTPDYLSEIQVRSEKGEGSLDPDTPAFKGMYEASLWVVGSVVDAVHRLMQNKVYHAFLPIAGLHHAYADHGGGFCVFNDCAIAIKLLQQVYGLRRIAYVDIDVHHGDGVFYSFIDDPSVLVVDIHQDPLFPGTGSPDEIGIQRGLGFKRNFTLQPFSGNKEFLMAWEIGLTFLKSQKPDFIILQCGADGIGGDPLAQLALTPASHEQVARDLSLLSKNLGHHRLLALGGGGYNASNVSKAWSTVIKALL